MTKLHQLHDRYGQSPWLTTAPRRRHQRPAAPPRRLRDPGRHLQPDHHRQGRQRLGRLRRQLSALTAAGRDAEASYWSLVTADLNGALAVLRPLYDQSGGGDGFVSLELAPALAHDTRASVAAARALHRRLAEPNLLVKIPATAEGVPAVHQAISEGLSINVTLLFGLDRYAQIIDAYLEGLEAHDGDLSRVHSVASFFVSRVDIEVDRRLEAIGTPQALALRGQAALAQARLAYRLFRDRFSGPRWQALAARGARVQRPLWASTSTKNPAPWPPPSPRASRTPRPPWSAWPRSGSTWARWPGCWRPKGWPPSPRATTGCCRCSRPERPRRARHEPGNPGP
jgi:transaldolase